MFCSTERCISIFQQEDMAIKSLEFDLHTLYNLQIFSCRKYFTFQIKSLKQSQLPVVHNPGKGGSDLVFISVV